MPLILNKWTCLDQAVAWAGSVSRLLVFIGIEACLEAFEPRSSWTYPDLTGARFGFGSGSRPLAC